MSIFIDVSYSEFDAKWMSLCFTGVVSGRMQVSRRRIPTFQCSTEMERAAGRQVRWRRPPMTITYMKIKRKVRSETYIFVIK